ncbi:hypothetical protein RM553_01305 [Zunongwangia sp. F363]|uniref:Prenyltransferase n=1 Tax=Autumnicola tepida TaxID=3075595 RepID=A0ABU3C541_9FLAO|nr:hypothetical protein [Zunongwangia sp. F363]MDT0641456.1 hypothetical protein [Zunongwangia sp. F363]
MNLLKNLLDLYINSSIHVALAVVSLSLVSFFKFQISPDYDLLLFIFFGSITGYNFVKYAGIAKLHHLSLTRNLRFIQVFSLVCFLGAGYFVLQQSWQILILSGVLGIFTLLYAVPFWKGKANLRSLNGTKVFVIAVVWAGTSVLLPLHKLYNLENRDVLIEFFQRFLLVIVLMLPFEIRDLKFDTLQLGTIPQRVGFGKTKILGYVLLLLVILAEVFKERFLLTNFISLVLVSLVSGTFLYKTRIDQQPYFASFWVEAIPVMWLGITVVVINLF